MAVECNGYHSRLAELIATTKGESYATTRLQEWLCAAEISITLLRRLASRRVHLELPDIDFQIEKQHANIRYGIENAISRELQPKPGIRRQKSIL